MPDPGARAGAAPRLYLKRHREQVLAWSQVKAAEVIGVHPSTLWRWEAGLIATIRPYDLQLIACAYGLDYADLASAEQRRAPPNPVPVPVPDPVLGWRVGDTVAAFRMVEESPVDHQMAGLRAGDDLTGLAREWLTADPVETPSHRGGVRVDLALVEQLEGMVLRLRHLDDQIGGADLLPAARQRHRRVADLLGGTYPSDVGRRLHAVAADLGQLLGWLAFDTGQHGLAQRQWIAALHAAHSAADAEIGANILAGMAMQCYVLGNPRDALSLVETAESAVDAHGSARVRSMLACRHAVAAAKAGDETASQHALSRRPGPSRGRRPRRAFLAVLLRPG
jgi:transcriptional regulator with XRE-family HTH domain